MLDLAADQPQRHLQLQQPPGSPHRARKPSSGRAFSALLSIFSFSRRRARTVSSSKSITPLDQPAPSYVQQHRSVSAAAHYPDLDARPLGHRFPYLHPILPNQQHSIDTLTADRALQRADDGQPGDIAGDIPLPSSAPPVPRRTMSHNRGHSASAIVPRPPQDTSSLQSPSHSPSAPIPIAAPPRSHLEPAPLTTFGRSSSHLPSSAATFGMPSSTSLRLPITDTDDRRSSLAFQGPPDDEHDGVSIFPSPEYDPDHVSPNQGVPASIASSYFSLSPSNALSGAAAVADAPPVAYNQQSQYSRTRRPSDSATRRQPSLAPSDGNRQRKASAASLSAREVDAPPPVPPLPMARPLPSVSASLSRPSMTAFGVTAASITDVASDGRRPLPSRPSPLTIPKARSFSDNLASGNLPTQPEEDSVVAASPAIVGLTRTYTRAEKGKGRAPATQVEPPRQTIRRLPPIPTRSQTVPLDGEYYPTADSVVSSPAQSIPSTAELWRTPTTAFTSPPPSSTAPRRLPLIPGEDRDKSRPLPTSKRSLPALPVLNTHR